MKNSKIKTWLTTVGIIAIFVTLMIYLFAIITESPYDENPLFYTWKLSVGDSGEYSMDWNYAGIFFTLLIVAFGAFLTKLVMFTVPAIKDRTHNACITLCCDLLVLVALLFAILGLFLPINFEINMNEYSFDNEPSRITGARVLGLLGTPMAFASGLASIGLSFKSGK